MCGIFAVISLTKEPLGENLGSRAGAALAAIRHRGPDASAVHLDSRGRWALGHVRLSVIDVGAASNQPFWSRCGRYGIAFNGEIYNYIELRAELERDGLRFRTSSDTEVLLAALVHWGPACLARLNGMWALVLLDRLHGKVLVARDRWGVKPLYIRKSKTHVVVASEAKAILAFEHETLLPNARAISNHLRYTIGGESNESWFEGIDRFPTATWQHLNLPWETSSDFAEWGPANVFWKYPDQQLDIDVESAVEEFGRLLKESIELRLRSDVPVAISLSGGLDSGLIAAVVGRDFGRSLRAFTAWHAPIESSELPIAMEVARRSGHEISPIQEVPIANINELVEHCTYHLDSGHGATAIVPYLGICKSARNFATVMLEGQGADEAFGGYSYMLPMACIDYALRLNPLQSLAAAAMHVWADGCTSAATSWIKYLSNAAYRNQYKVWGRNVLLHDRSELQVHDLLSIRLSPDNLREQCIVRHRTGLVNLLQYGDAISMSVNLETRCPFLDYRVVDFGLRLPLPLRVRNGKCKYLLRRYGESCLPPAVTRQCRKLGFPNSTERMLRSSYARNGLPFEAVRFSIDAGLLAPESAESGRILALPNGPFFKIASLWAWANAFYCHPKFGGLRSESRTEVVVMNPISLSNAE